MMGIEATKLRKSFENVQHNLSVSWKHKQMANLRLLYGLNSQPLANRYSSFLLQ